MTTQNSPQLPTLVLIHGFLDDATVWDDLVDALGSSVPTVRVELLGSGQRWDEVTDPADLSLELFARQTGEIVDKIDGPVVIVGQSMGTQVAELVAADRHDHVRALVLLTPVPLAGTGLPDEAVAPFRALGGQVEVQRVVRAQLSPGLSDASLDRLGISGGRVAPPIVARYVDIWNAGSSRAQAVSDFSEPVLVVRGDADGFVTEDLVNGVIAPHFPAVQVATIAGGGHWLHVEQPERLSEIIMEFLATLSAGSGWRAGFADSSATAFADGFTKNVTLEASVLTTPITGRDQVAATLAVASAVYESLEFTAETTAGSTTYLQWHATAFGGTDIFGVTVLEKDSDGKVARAAIHHRPLGAALRFSEELRQRLVGVIPAEHFFAGNATVESID